MKRVKWIILVAVAVMLLISPCVNAEYVSEQKETLRGIEGVGVLVEHLEPGIKQLGLTRKILQTDVELKLRLAGVKVLSLEESFKTLRGAILYLYINTIPIRSDVIFIYNASLHLKQFVNLRTKEDTSTYAVTWAESSTGYAGKEVIKEVLRRITKDKVDMFLNDYLAVNPIQPNKPKGRNLLKENANIPPGFVLDETPKP